MTRKRTVKTAIKMITIISTIKTLTITSTKTTGLNYCNEKVDTEPVLPVSTNSDYEYEEDILPTYIK